MANHIMKSFFGDFLFLSYFIDQCNAIIVNGIVLRSARLKQDENGNTTTITKRMDKIAKEYDGIWSINEDELAEMMELIEIDMQEEEFYDDLIANTKYDLFKQLFFF